MLRCCSSLSSRPASWGRMLQARGSSSNALTRTTLRLGRETYNCFSMHAPRAVSSTRHDGQLTAQEVSRFREEGYLVLEGFASKEECNALKERADELVAAFQPEATSVFSTRNQKTTTDEYFLDSGANISFFFEEKAFDTDGQLVAPKPYAINKIGHALHDLDPVFRSFSRSERMAALARSLGFRRPAPVQSMYICKQPSIGGEVVPHQDASFLATVPQPSVVGFWLAVEDARVDNGCLLVLPRSHFSGVHRRFLLDATDRSVRFDRPALNVDLSQLQPLEAPAGTLVLLHGENVHGSSENTSPVSRHAYAMHVVETAPGFTWASDNWLHRPADMPFEPLFLDA